MAIDLKQQTKRITEGLYNEGKLELIDELCAPTYIGLDPLIGPFDRGGFKKQVLGYRNAFPDLKIEMTSLVCEGNTVVAQWKATGTHQGMLGELAPTGKTATVTGLTWTEYEGGKIVRDRTEWDALGLFRQLGVEGVARVPSSIEEAALPAAPH